MGNRAIVVFVDDVSKPSHISPAVYLHWNGGPTPADADAPLRNYILFTPCIVESLHA